jgi:hypothetical protein
MWDLSWPLIDCKCPAHLLTVCKLHITGKNLYIDSQHFAWPMVSSRTLKVLRRTNGWVK